MSLTKVPSGMEQLLVSIRKKQGRFLTTRQVAEMLGIKPQTLRKWRMSQAGKGPPFYKGPNRSARVSYSELEVKRFIDGNASVAKCKER